MQLHSCIGEARLPPRTYTTAVTVPVCSCVVNTVEAARLATWVVQPTSPTRC